MTQPHLTHEHINYSGQPLWKRLRADRPLTSYTMVQVAVGRVLRNRWTAGCSRSDYLNVGCGVNTLSGFVNLDYAWRPGVDVCWDLARPLPFANRSMRGIYTEHCLEHIPREACQRVLRELHDMLRPSGVLRIVVPDAELFLRTYIRVREGSSDDFPNVESRPQDWTPMHEVNRIFREHGHLYAYDFDTLAVLLRKAGFSDIRRQVYRHGIDARLLVDSPSRESESMYVEAVRTT